MQLKSPLYVGLSRPLTLGKPSLLLLSSNHNRKFLVAFFVDGYGLETNLPFLPHEVYWTQTPFLHFVQVQKGLCPRRLGAMGSVVQGREILFLDLHDSCSDVRNIFRFWAECFQACLFNTILRVKEPFVALKNCLGRLWASNDRCL